METIKIEFHKSNPLICRNRKILDSLKCNWNYGVQWAPNKGIHMATHVGFAIVAIFSIKGLLHMIDKVQCAF